MIIWSFEVAITMCETYESAEPMVGDIVNVSRWFGVTITMGEQDGFTEITNDPVAKLSQQIGVAITMSEEYDLGEPINDDIVNVSPQFGDVQFFKMREEYLLKNEDNFYYQWRLKYRFRYKAR